MNRWLTLTLLLVSTAALGLRLPNLADRPLHNDEAVNAVLFQRLWEQGAYRYNPDEHHGPTLPYATLPFVWLTGTKDFNDLSEKTLRLVAVVAGVALILLVAMLRDALGAPATAVAAGLLALSPAMVFYSRYYIHEMLLVAFSLLLLASLWRYARSRTSGWALASGVSLGLMHATKETFVLTLAAIGFAGLVTRTWRQSGSGDRPPDRPVVPARHLALALGAAALVSGVLFTSFFTNLRGPLDSLTTYLPWLRRASGQSPHLHPWSYYLEHLFWFHPDRGPLWTELLIGLLALAGAGASLAGRGLGAANLRFARFLTAYAATLVIAYSAIAYKTPWCLLNFLLPLILLAGLGALALLRLLPHRAWRWGLTLSLVFGTAHLAWQAWRASHEFAAHRDNPYTYSQTVPNALELTDRVKAITRVSPQGARTEIKVVAPESEYWPLPWYLRQLSNVWWFDALPDDPFAPIIVVSASLQAALDERSDKRYLSVGFYELRPKEFFELYVEFELWKAFVETLPRPTEGDED